MPTIDIRGTVRATKVLHGLVESSDIDGLVQLTIAVKGQVE